VTEGSERQQTGRSSYDGRQTREQVILNWTQTDDQPLTCKVYNIMVVMGTARNAERRNARCRTDCNAVLFVQEKKCIITIHTTFRCYYIMLVIPVIRHSGPYLVA